MHLWVALSAFSVETQKKDLMPMAAVVIPTLSAPATSGMQVSVYVQTEVTASEIARKAANVWLLDNVGNLLRAETPELILGDPPDLAR